MDDRVEATSAVSVHEARRSAESQVSGGAAVEEEEEELGQPYVLAGANTHRFVSVPPYMVPQNLADTFLQMSWLQHIVKVHYGPLFSDFIQFLQQAWLFRT